MPRRPRSSPLERIASLFADPKARAPRASQPAAEAWVILAIGNPGAEYADTRHNVGWWAADALCRRHRATPRSNGASRTATITIADQQAVVAYPNTYVNRSGSAARELMNRHHTPIHRLIVITDDINLAVGRIRVRRGGGPGGHNGLKSIIAALNDDGFPRIRIGVGKPDRDEDQIDYVLGVPEGDDSEAIRHAVDNAAEAAEAIVSQGVETAMNEFNGRRGAGR